MADVYDIPLRVAVAGNVDAGKSSFLGVLKSGEFDDGTGKARRHIFNYLHEEKTGRTSSIAQRSIDINGKKVIFYDLAGHERYLRTTLFGMSSSYPHLALILVEPNKLVSKGISKKGRSLMRDDLPKMTKEHIITAIYLRIPFAFVITKMDLAQPELLTRTIKLLKVFMISIKKKLYEVRTQDDIMTCKKSFGSKIVPLFKISNVEGDSFDPPFHYLTDYLTELNEITEVADEKKDESLFVIDNSFRVKGFPLIGSGYMRRGTIKVGQKDLFLGPIYGKLVPIVIRTLHDDDKTDVHFLRKNEMGCVAINVKDDVITSKRQIRSGMIITNNPKMKFVKKFRCSVTIFSNHHTTIKRGSNTVIHCGMIKKAIVIDEIEKDGQSKDCLRGGDNNISVIFSFMYGRHYIEPKDLFIFREGNTRGCGIVDEILD